MNERARALYDNLRALEQRARAGREQPVNATPVARQPSMLGVAFRIAGGPHSGSVAGCTTMSRGPRSPDQTVARLCGLWSASGPSGPTTWPLWPVGEFGRTGWNTPSQAGPPAAAKTWITPRQCKGFNLQAESGWWRDGWPQTFQWPRYGSSSKTRRQAAHTQRGKTSQPAAS